MLLFRDILRRSVFFLVGFSASWLPYHFQLPPILMDIPLNSDVLTGGALLIAAATAVYQMKISLSKDISDVADRTDKDLDVIRKEFADMRTEIALTKQKVDSVVEGHVQIKGRVATQEAISRDLQNWIQTRGGDFQPRTGWGK